MNQARTKIEHANGLLKSRFPCLRSLNLKIKKRQDIGKVVNIVVACCILHNFLLQGPDIPQEWYDELSTPIVEDPEAKFRFMLDESSEDPELQSHRIFNFVLEYFDYIALPN